MTTPADPCAAERERVNKLREAIVRLYDAIHDELMDLDHEPSSRLARTMDRARRAYNATAPEEDQ